MIKFYCFHLVNEAIRLPGAYKRKVGATNPVVGLKIYDVESKKTITVDVRDGLSFTDDVVGHYIYGID